LLENEEIGMKFSSKLNIFLFGKLKLLFLVAGVSIIEE
jgi:hypothetical protein